MVQVKSLQVKGHFSLVFGGVPKAEAVMQRWEQSETERQV